MRSTATTIKNTFVLFVQLVLLAFSSTAQNNAGLKINPSALNCFDSLYHSNQTDTTDKAIVRKWVQMDIKNIRTILEPLAQKGTTVRAIEKIAPGFLNGKCNCSSTQNDLGYGLKTILFTYHGGYGSIAVNALVFNDTVVKLRLSIHNNYTVFNNYLAKELSLPFTCHNGYIVFDTIYSANLTHYVLRQPQFYLQPGSNNTYRSQAISYFADVLTGSEFTEPYRVILGLGSQTFNYLRYFINNNDYPALENILNCANPTGRLFAAKALQHLQQAGTYNMPQLISQRIKQVIADSKPVASGIVSCFMGKFNYDYYDVDRNFETLLLESINAGQIRDNK